MGKPRTPCGGMTNKILNMENVVSRVNAIIVDKLGVDESEISPESSFTNDLGADSLDTIELIMEVEKIFDISIPDDERDKLNTVEKVYTYLENIPEKE